MNHEMAWKALTAAVLAESKFHEFQRDELCALMLRALSDPETLVEEIAERKAEEQRDRDRTKKQEDKVIPI